MKYFHTIALVLSIFLISIPTNTNAQFVTYCVNCSTMLTQALDRVTNIQQLEQLYSQVTEALKQTEQQIQLVQTTFNQYENMVKNTTSLPNTIKSRLQGEFNKLTSLTKELNVMRGDASGLSQVYRAVYTGRTSIQGIAHSTDAAGQWRDMFGRMSDDADRAQEAAFQESGTQIADLEQKATELDSQLDDLLTTPDGQMQAIQAGNQIAGMGLQELQKLRSLVAVSAQASVQKQSQDSKKQQIMDEEDVKAVESLKKTKDEINNIDKTPF